MEKVIYLIFVCIEKAVVNAIYLLPAFILLILYLIGKNYSLRQIRYKRYFSPDGAFEGEDISLIEEVTNNSFLPVFRVDIQSLVNEKIQLYGYHRQDQPALQKFISRFTIMPFTTVRRTHKAVCKKRGFYQLETAQIIYLKKVFLLKSEASLSVYPKLLPFACAHRLDCYLQSMEPSDVPLLADPFSFSGIREYKHGDAFHIINFKATARHGGRFHVNQTDFITSRRQMLYLNFETASDYPTEQYKQYMETALSYSTYLLDKAVSNGYEIGFSANCQMFYGKKYLRYPISSGNSSSYKEILNELSWIIISRGYSISSLLHMDIQDHLSNTEIVLMTLTMDERTEQAVRLLEALDNQIHIVWLQEV